MDYFFQPAVPSREGTTIQTQPRALNVHYQMDAHADTPDGLNTSLVTGTIVWADIPKAQAQAIVDFMRAHVARRWRWIIPQQATERCFICTSYTRTYPDPGYDRVEIQIEERPMP